MSKADHSPRIVGGFSLFEKYDLTLCPKENGSGDNRDCGYARTVDCCKQTPGMDVVECSKCGLQRAYSCDFDQEMS